MKGYKAFDENLKCRDMQYEVEVINMFRRKKKCGVCGYRVTPEKEAIYIAEQPRSLTETFSKAPTRFNVTDCPRCGCQITLAVRNPEVKEREENV